MEPRQLYLHLLNDVGAADVSEADPPRVLDRAVGQVTVQELLDTLSGDYSWLVPVRDEAGAVRDFQIEAASPEAVDVAGRRGTGLVGVRVREAYPTLVDGPVWRTYLQVLADGGPREISPYTHTETGAGVPAESVYSVRVNRLGQGLLVGWVRHDDEARHGERIAQTERLGNLGWVEWDLVSGHTAWSDELYRIYDRDPALGPLSNDELSAMTVPEDQPIRLQAARTFAAGQTTDVTYRIRVGGRTKHVRTVVDAVRDGSGRPLKIYGIVQDVTARETARVRIAEVERELDEHRETLAAEHRMTARLQHIILPIPAGPVDLPGLRVAVRYLPAERTGRVGGDWFHATRLPDGPVLLAIGDVAGHGIQAATVMAQLRHALTALAVTTTTDPGELLNHLNRLLCAGEHTETATAVVACYDPGTRTITWAQAGHPAPLRTRGGVTTELPRPRGPLLGVVPDVRYECARLTLELGDLLLLYTDGLVEKRDRSFAEGLAPVIDTLNRITAERSPQPLADLLAQLHQANPDDDTCILAVRALPDPVPADAHPDRVDLLNREFDFDSLAAVRHEVARHSGAAGLADAGLHWFVVAVNEITTNAVRHGGGSGRVSLWVDHGRVHCRVADEGPGIPPGRERDGQRPPPGTLSGRGLWLARQGCESIAFDSDATGTRVTLSQPILKH